jgi:hypothetical protein
MHRRSTVWAALGDDLRDSGLAAIERVILAHDPDRFGVPGRQILAVIDGMQKLPLECAAWRLGACFGDIQFPGLRIGDL